MRGEHDGSKAVLWKGGASGEPALRGEARGDCGRVNGEAGGEGEGSKAECGVVGWGEEGAGCGWRREAASVRGGECWS